MPTELPHVDDQQLNVHTASWQPWRATALSATLPSGDQLLAELQPILQMLPALPPGPARIQAIQSGKVTPADRPANCRLL